MNGNALCIFIYIFRVGTTGRRTDSEGWIWVLHMRKPGHGRQLVIRIWSLGKRGTESDIQECLTWVPSFPTHVRVSSGPAKKSSFALPGFAKVETPPLTFLSHSCSTFIFLHSGPITLLAIAQIKTLTPLDLGTWDCLSLEALLAAWKDSMSAFKMPP